MEEEYISIDSQGQRVCFIDERNVTREMVETIRREANRTDSPITEMRLRYNSGMVADLFDSSIVKKLKLISFSAYILCDRLARSIANGFSSCQALTKLSIFFNDSTSQVEFSAAEMLGMERGLRSLKKICLGFANKNTNHFLHTLINAIVVGACRSSNIQSIDFYHIHISTNMMECLTSAICFLSRIWLDRCKFQMNDFFKLAQALPHAAGSLKRLNLFHCDGILPADIAKALEGAMADTEERLGNTSLIHIRIDSSASSTLNFYCHLNEAGFRGFTNSQDMTPEKWLTALLKMSHHDKDKDIIDHAFYLLRYNPSWWCAV